MREVHDMLKNTHEGRFFRIKDSPILLFPNSLDSINWKVTNDRVHGETCSPGTQERAKIVRVLRRKKVIYITHINNDILPYCARDKKVLHTVFAKATESTASRTNPAMFL